MINSFIKYRLRESKSDTARLNFYLTGTKWAGPQKKSKHYLSTISILGIGKTHSKFKTNKLRHKNLNPLGRKNRHKLRLVSLKRKLFYGQWTNVASKSVLGTSRKILLVSFTTQYQIHCRKQCSPFLPPYFYQPSAGKGGGAINWCLTNPGHCCPSQISILSRGRMELVKHAGCEINSFLYANHLFF